MRWVAALIVCGVALGATGCGVSGPDAPGPFWWRAACAVERWLDRNDMRVRWGRAEPCERMARELDRGRKAVRDWVDRATEPAPDEPSPKGDPPAD